MGKSYTYRVLPFSLALSPHTFTKCMDAALATLRLQGIRIFSYDEPVVDIIKSEEMAVRLQDVVLCHIRCL